MYTKGKWIVHEWGDKFQVVEAKVTTTCKHGITMSGQKIIAKEITEANAQLISASPDLYEACKGILNTLDYAGWLDSVDPVVVGEIKELKQAISKAEGK